MMSKRKRVFQNFIMLCLIAVFCSGVHVVQASATFKGCENLVEIQLPNRLKSIGDRAFEGCKSLKSVAIESAGREAFYGCTALEKVYNRDGIADEKAFYGCKKLKRIEFGAEPFRIGKNAFKNINKKAVFVVQKQYAKKWKQFLTKETGFQQTMKIKTKKNEDSIKTAALKSVRQFLCKISSESYNSPNI